MKRASLLRAALLAVGIVAFAARADVFDTFGFGPRGASMGGALTAEVNDYSAVFYNPARLVQRNQLRRLFQSKSGNCLALNQ